MSVLKSPNITQIIRGAVQVILKTPTGCSVLSQLVHIKNALSRRKLVET
jgi:hypothetical protein